MKKKLLLTIILLGMPVIILSSAGNNEFIYKNGLFSFKYPESFKTQPFQYPTEVARFSAANIYKVPVLVAHFSKKKKGFKPDDIPQTFMKRITTRTPGTSGFKTVEKKNIVLKDGSKAYLFKINWLWIDGKTPLETVSISAIKGDKLVTLTCTAFTAQNLSKEIAELCMTLNINPGK